MSKELKTGDKITCFIEQKLPNCLVVRFQNGKAGSGNSTSVFRGVLIDECSPVTKRVVSSSPINTKPRLTKEFTATFIENFNSKHVSGKALRNKNPSCIVLDDFCIDYHNTCSDAKPEKRKQYLQPKGVIAHASGKNGITEKGKVDMQHKGDVPSRRSENDTGPSRDADKRFNALGKTEVPVILSNSGASDAVFQNDSCLAKEMANEQVENRYSKRSRAEKPKRFFGSEFDLHPGFDKKHPSKAMIDENKKKESSSAPKPKWKEETKDKKVKDKVYEKVDTKCESLSSQKDVNGAVKRSARIQLKRSRKDDSKLDAIFEAVHSKELYSNKRKKLDASRNGIASNPKSHSRTSTQNRDDAESKSETSATCCSQSNYKKSKIPSEGTKYQTFTQNEKSIKIQKSTGSKTHKVVQSPKKPDKKIMHQRPSEACLLKQKSALKTESSNESNNMNVCNETNKDNANDDFLLCHEPALNDDFDCLQNYHKKLAVLMQAEKVLGGKITLLYQEDNTELEKPSKESTIDTSKAVKGKVESTQLFKINTKSRELAAASKIIIDRSKGIVSIQPPAFNDRSGDKQGEQISEAILSGDGHQSEHKHEANNNVFIVINKRPQGMAQDRTDTQCSRLEIHETEAERSKEKICSPGGEGKLKNMVTPKEGSCSQARSNERGQTTIKDDADSCLNRGEDNMESIYAKLSFNRLLASVHEEAAKANFRTMNDTSREKLCAISNISKEKITDGSISDKVQKPDGGAHSSVESNIQLKNVRKFTKGQKDDLRHNLEESHTSQRIAEDYSHSLKEGIISSDGDSDEENDHAVVWNASAQNDIISNSCNKDEQVSRLKDVNISLGLEGQSEKISKQSKVSQALLDALRALKADAKSSSEENSPQSGAILPNLVHKQDYIASSQNTQESNNDLRLIRRHNLSLFKAKTSRQQRPSFELISGLRNIEQKMTDLSRGQKMHLLKCSLLRDIDSVGACNFIKHNTSPGNEISRNDNDMAVVELQVNCESSHGNGCCIVKENIRDEKCKIALDNKSSPLLEGVQNHEPCTSKQRRKSLKPVKNISILRAHAEKSLTHPVLSKNVQAKILQFDGKRTVTCSRSKSDSKTVGQESEGKAWNTSDNGTKRWLSGSETLPTVYSLGKIRKSYKHTKRGARKYPVPSRSSIRRNPRYCWKVLGKAHTGKDDSEGSSCDLLAAKKPNAAREQGEELLKEILKLNKGILIRQDF